MNIYDSLLLLPLFGVMGFLYWDLFTYDWDWATKPIQDQ
jgi:hypothetical protein